MRKRERERGMMLIEIMVVVAIIGLVMGGVAVVAWRAYQRALLREAHIEIHALKEGIQHWKLNGNDRVCPATLDELFAGKYITKAPKDPWGQPFVYVCPAQNDEGYEVASKGPDRIAATEDDIRDSAEHGKEGRGSASQ
jgi:general secretion pathway protein G